MLREVFLFGVLLPTVVTVVCFLGFLVCWCRHSRRRRLHTCCDKQTIIVGGGGGGGKPTCRICFPPRTAAGRYAGSRVRRPCERCFGRVTVHPERRDDPKTVSSYAVVVVVAPKNPWFSSSCCRGEPDQTGSTRRSGVGYAVTAAAPRRCRGILPPLSVNVKHSYTDDDDGGRRSDAVLSDDLRFGFRNQESIRCADDSRSPKAYPEDHPGLGTGSLRSGTRLAFGNPDDDDDDEDFYVEVEPITKKQLENRTPGFSVVSDDGNLTIPIGYAGAPTDRE